jgi:glycosyltransferase involved in cell wall biosynthesis
MKICVVSHEYDPFYGGGIATYHNSAARRLAGAGHEVHVVTNAATFGREEPSCTEPRWQEGNLTVHRLPYFDENGVPPTLFHFFDTLPDAYRDEPASWAGHISNHAAYTAANYIERLHADVGLDVLESPEYFAEAFYVLRRRLCGEGQRLPAVCVHGHTSTRLALRSNRDVWSLGNYPRRQMMAREEYCLREADGLVTPSVSMLRRYEIEFPHSLPRVRDVIPHFLDLPTQFGPLPDGLAEGQYIAVVGRIEGRKGTDTAIRAFSRLADEYPDLKLVLVGGDSWRPGESVDEMITFCLPAKHHDRLVRTGRVPRQSALRIIRDSCLVIHPALWDNYPFAVMEAMALGAVCVVSNGGGHSEMIEHGQSGIVFQAGSAEDLADAARSVLSSSTLSAQVRGGALRRIAEITSADLLVDRKISHYERAIRSARRRIGSTTRPAECRREATSRSDIPGCGLVLLDACDADDRAFAITMESILGDVESSAGWRVAKVTDSNRHDGDSCFVGLSPSDVIVYVLAGVRLDTGAIRSLVTQILHSRTDCGSFAWLRPASCTTFPYQPDLNWQDLLRTGQILPPAFAVAVAHLPRLPLSFLRGRAERIGAMMSAASARTGLVFRHTGRVLGDFDQELPAVDAACHQTLTGFLDWLEVASL